MASELTVQNKVKQKMIAYLRNCFAFSDEVSVGLFEKFEGDLKGCYANIQSALKNKDEAALRSEIHALKGVLLNGGLTEEGDFANILGMKAAERANWDELSGDVRKLFGRILETQEVADKKRALVVEDMEFVREFVKKSLAKLFPTMATVVASDGQSALDLLDKEAFDLVVCDWELPGGIDGMEILKRLRGNARTKDTPFMMLTAKGEREHVVQAMQLGANDYVVKPIKLDTLATKIRKLVFPSG